MAPASPHRRWRGRGGATVGLPHHPFTRTALATDLIVTACARVLPMSAPLAALAPPGVAETDIPAVALAPTSRSAASLVGRGASRALAGLGASDPGVPKSWSRGGRISVPVGAGRAVVRRVDPKPPLALRCEIGHGVDQGPVPPRERAREVRHELRASTRCMARSRVGRARLADSE